MEKNLGDIVIDKLLERNKTVIAKLNQRYGRMNPFRMKPMSQKELMEHFNEMPQEERIRIFEELRRKK